MTGSAGGTEVPAVEVGVWFRGLAAALDGTADSDVPCGSCIACCSSSQFVHIEPHEHDALAHIPSELLFPAPRMPGGHVLMGYDQRGRCPMLSDRGCTIYAHRPRTCRTYDCRIFPVAGVLPEEPEKAAIAARAGEWQLRTEDDAAAVLLAAARAAAARFRAEEPELPGTPLAVRACRAALATDSR